MTDHWIEIYSNQKDNKNYISPSNIRASVETRLPKLHNLLQFSPPFHPWHFIGVHPQALRGSAIHVFLVLIIKNFPSCYLENGLDSLQYGNWPWWNNQPIWKASYEENELANILS